MPRAEEAIVLAGGFGTRLRSVVADLPKPLAPVAGRPFLEYLLDQLASNGLRRVVLATGYLAELIEQSVGSRWAGMDIVYSQESEPLGTGGAIRQASRLLLGDGVHVANGDTFLRYDLRLLEEAVHTTGGLVGVALAKVPDVSRYGAVEVSDDRVVAFLEKGRHGIGMINAGSYFLTASALASLPTERTAFSFESEVLMSQASGGRLIAFQQTHDFIDIGVPEDYRRAQSLFGKTS